jgi:hypothetical protein
MNHGGKRTPSKAGCESKRIHIHIPPEERAFMVKWIGDMNWSEICCRALMRAAEERKKFAEIPKTKC